jgi:hypothetical protein
VGLARAEAYRAQVAALGAVPTALVNAVTALSDKNLRFVPEILVAGGNGTGAIDGLAAALMRHFSPGAASPAAEKKRSIETPPTKGEIK